MLSAAICSSDSVPAIFYTHPTQHQWSRVWWRESTHARLAHDGDHVLGGAEQRQTQLEVERLDHAQVVCAQPRVRRRGADHQQLVALPPDQVRSSITNGSSVRAAGSCE
jgi:hypothetical protein